MSKLGRREKIEDLVRYVLSNAFTELRAQTDIQLPRRG